MCSTGTLHAEGERLYAGDATPDKFLSPFGKKLLQDLKSAGKYGIEPAKLRIAGMRKELRKLVKLKFAVSLGGTIYYSIDEYRNLAARIIEGLSIGSTLTISQAKEKTALSRKYVIPLLNRMESDGILKRQGDVRVVTGTGSGQEEELL